MNIPLKLVKMGNSLAFVVPKELRDGLARGTMVSYNLCDGRRTAFGLRPITLTSKPKWTSPKKSCARTVIFCTSWHSEEPVRIEPVWLDAQDTWPFTTDSLPNMAAALACAIRRCWDRHWHAHSIGGIMAMMMSQISPQPTPLGWRAIIHLSTATKTAWVLARLFLAVNRIDLHFDKQDATQMMIALAAGELSEEKWRTGSGSIWRRIDRLKPPIPPTYLVGLCLPRAHFGSMEKAQSIWSAQARATPIC